MKLFLTFLFLPVLPLIAQGQQTLATGTAPATVAAAPGQAGIIGSLPDGSSTAPPTPRLIIPGQDLIGSRAVRVGGRKVTIQKVAPIQLPPVPEAAPVIPGQDEADPEASAPDSGTSSDPGSESGASGESGASTTPQIVFVTANVFHLANQPDQVRTLVRFSPTANASPIIIWSTADWNYLTGFTSYAGADGQPYGLVLAVTDGNVADQDELNRHFGGTSDAPRVPRFTSGNPASFVVVNGANDEASLGAIRALHELYNRDVDTLKAAWLGRKQAAEAKAAELAANPPEKKPLVLKYWRIDQAGQQGATPKPADIR